MKTRSEAIKAKAEAEFNKKAKELEEKVEGILDNGAKELALAARTGGSVEEVSRKLADELNKSNAVPPGGYSFPSVQRKVAPLRADLRQIVETHWVEDMNAAWHRIRGMLKVGEKRNHHGHLTRALDDARELSHEAHGLAVTAKLEAKKWESLNDVVFAAMWSDATRACQHEKDQGQRSKSITDTDIRLKCATLYPDQWHAQEIDREKVNLTVKRMEQLAKDASDKCDDIKVMLSKLRSQG